MSAVHRTLAGGWAKCSDPACPLKFHFPDITLDAAERLPMHVLYPLLELADPPYSDHNGQKIWRDEDDNTHRDYDLPAVIESDGSMMWFRRGRMHREGQPARIWPDGTSLYYTDGKLRRPAPTQEAKP